MIILHPRIVAFPNKPDRDVIEEVNNPRPASDFYAWMTAGEVPMVPHFKPWDLSKLSGLPRYNVLNKSIENGVAVLCQFDDEVFGEAPISALPKELSRISPLLKGKPTPFKWYVQCHGKILDCFCWLVYHSVEIQTAFRQRRQKQEAKGYRGRPVVVGTELPAKAKQPLEEVYKIPRRKVKRALPAPNEIPRKVQRITAFFEPEKKQ